jgi:WD40 repeat protein
MKNGYLASCSSDQTIKIWDIYDGNLIKTLVGHRSFVNCIVVINSIYLASGSDDKTVKIWNTDTGNLKYTLKGHSSRG